MTIREYFQRTLQRVSRGFTLVAVIVVVALVFRYPKVSPFLLGLVMGIPACIVLFFLLRGRFKCPRCGADLQKLSRDEARAARRAKGWRGWLDPEMRQFWVRWNACPQCGVSFDAQY